MQKMTVGIKRCLSFIMALAMVLGLLPTAAPQSPIRVSAAATSQTIDTYSNFKSIVDNETGLGDFWLNDAKYTENISKFTLSNCAILPFKEMTSDAVWNKTVKTGSSRTAKIEAYSLFTELYAGEQMGFKINVKNEGLYTIGFLGCIRAAYKNGATADVEITNGNGDCAYIGKYGYGYYSSASSVPSGYTAGIVNASIAQAKKYFTAQVYLTKGENTLVFKGTDNPANGQRVFSLRQVYLTPASASSASTSIDPTTTRTEINKIAGNSTQVDFWADDDIYTKNVNLLLSRYISVNENETSEAVLNNGTRTALFRNVGLYSELYEDEKLAYYFHAPKAGWYTLDIMGVVCTDYLDGAATNVTVKNHAGDSYNLGSFGYKHFSETDATAFAEAHPDLIDDGYTFVGGGTWARLTKAFTAKVYLTAGMNTLIFEGRDNANDGKAVLGFRMLYLNPIVEQVNILDAGGTAVTQLMLKEGSSSKTELKLNVGSEFVADVKASDFAVAVDSDAITSTISEENGKIYLTVTSSRAGKGSFTVSSGNADAVTVDVQVAPDTGNLNYEFVKAYDGNETSDYGLNIKYAYNTGGNPEELNKLILSEPWEFGSMGGSYFRYVGIRAYNGLQNYPIGSVNSVKLKVTKAGTYYPCVIFGGEPGIGGTMGQAWLTDADGNELARSTDANTTLSKAPVLAMLETKSPDDDDSVYLEEGEYRLYWTGSKKAPGWEDKAFASTYLKAFRLLTQEHAKKLSTLDGTATATEDLSYDFTVLRGTNYTQSFADAITYDDSLDAGSTNAWKLYSHHLESVADINKAISISQNFTYFDRYVTGLRVGGSIGTVMVHVPKSGYYIPMVKFSTSHATGQNHTVSMYSLEDNRSFKELLVKKVINQKTNDGITDVILTTTPIYMEAGEYALSAETAHSTLCSLELDAVENALFSDIGPLSIKPGETRQNVLIDITDSKGDSVDFTDGKVYATVANSDVADFDLNIGVDGKVYYNFQGKAHGTTTAELIAIDKDDRALITTVKLSVNPEGLLVGTDHIYNFKKVDSGTAVTPITSVTYGMTAAGGEAEINPSVATSPWRYISHSADFFKYEDSTNGIFLGNTSASAVFGIELEESGVYQFISTHTVQPNGGLVKVYVAPDGASEPTSEDYYMGTIDSYGAVRTANQQSALAMRYLEKGEYTLTYVLSGSNTAIPQTRFDFTSATLKASDANTSLSISAQLPESLTINESSTVNLSIAQTDGIETKTPATDITVTMEPAGILDYEIISNEDNTEHSIKFTAKGSGTVNVTIRATDEIGLFAETSSPVLVMNPQQQATRTYKYTFVGVLNDGDSVNRIDSYAKTLSGSGQELRPGFTTDNWKYYTHNSSAFAYINDNHGVNFNLTGQHASIIARLPESGLFRPVINYTAQNLGSIVRVYIAPADAEDYLDDKWAVGTIDSYAETSNSSYSSALRSRYLTAGEYIISVKAIGGNPAVTITPRLWFKGYELQPIGEAHPELRVSCQDQVAVSKGGLVNVPVSAEIIDIEAAQGEASDMAEETLIGAEYEVISGNEYVAVASSYDEANGASITFIGKQSTNSTPTEIEVAVKLSGETRATFKTNITVGEAISLKNVKIQLPGYAKDSLSLRDLNKPDAILETLLYDENGVQLTDIGIDILGGAEYEYTSSNEEVATVSDAGVISPLSLGSTTISCRVTLNGITKDTQMELVVASGKTKSTFYAAERVANARENIQKYSWARSTRDAAVRLADKYADEATIDRLWNIVTTQELPRSYHVGYRGEPDAAAGVCRYCGTSLASEYGDTHSWIIDPLNSPWKIQCPSCRRKFPSNDFGKFYETGLDEYRNWSYEQAKENGSQYLTNDLYPEKGAGWGVDDGYGYVTGRTSSNGIPEVHTYIACYNHWGIWKEYGNTEKGIIFRAMDSLADAYIYTGEAKYARGGAILVDRVADVWKDMVFGVNSYMTTANGNYEPKGKALDWIWENGPAQSLLKGYDAFYDIYDDPYVVNYINKKAQQYNYFGNENRKETANQIREYIEDYVVREAFESCETGHINGNFGMPQNTAVIAGIVLDTKPETEEMFDWAFRTGTGTGTFQPAEVTGGNINEIMINKVDRDGQTTEVAPHYSEIWTGGLSAIIDNLANYGHEEYNLYNNPKVVKMLWSPIQLALSNGGAVAIGDDNNNCGGNNMPMYPLVMGRAWRNTKLPIFAQLAYYLNGNSSAGLSYDIFTKNPETFSSEVNEVIKTYGEYDMDKSGFLPGYGFVILRDGVKHTSTGGNTYNTKRNFWFHFGYNSGHGQPAALNLGVEAYGLNMAPEFGYPIAAAGDEFSNWGEQSISHNLVVVNDGRQSDLVEASATPYHMEDAGRVKIMDVDAADAYAAKGVSEYRRTVVMIEANDEVSYGIDFFRVLGGSTHLYSFHAMSDHLAEEPVMINTASGVDEKIKFTAQTDEEGNYVGTYAGADIEYRTPNITSGYSYLKNIDKALEPKTGQFAVDFAITDFRNDISLDDTEQLHLRMSMLNEDPVEEITIATGSPADKANNPQNLKFMLVRNSGSDSLFTTVIEPYATERYISKTEQIPSAQIMRVDGDSLSPITASDVVKAVKVTFANNQRVDYVIYAQDNTTEYLIKDGDFQLPFKGFIGVYTIDGNGVPLYTYLSDGTKLGDITALDAYNGTIVDYTDTLEFDNFVYVDFGTELDSADEEALSSLVGRFMYFNNEAYEIKSAAAYGDGIVKIGVGDSTLISSVDLNDNYSYFASIDAPVRIPLSVTTDTSPEFNKVNDSRVTANNKFTTYVKATSPVDEKITYSAISLPRGAQFNEETGEISWTPDEKQIGEHHFAISASDGRLSSAVHFTVEVFKSAGSTTPTPPSDDSNQSGGSTAPDSGSGTGSGSGGGGGGGGGTGGGSSSGEISGNSPSTDNSTGGDNTIDIPDITGERFIDLGGYDWAKESINSLAMDGIINGTSLNTFSPGKNITRADFAILLVRAFGITEGEGENFADVAASAYYAEELRLAKSAGIVNGIGENRFNPTGEISRQDMMLMLARALDAAGYELSPADLSVLAQFTDSAEVSDYAKDAVSRLIRDEIVAGSNGRINPKAKATRAEVAVVLYRIVK